MPEAPNGFALKFLGLLCLADPLRADVPRALRECSEAGIRVIMITGDHPGTALAIARQAGLDVAAGVLTGEQVETLPDAELAQRLRSVNVFARTTPEHKLRLVQALKANGEVIAMTGDGVNDAPALKAAHVGVAMGARGTDVAREAASIVLVNDDFASLVAAVRLGRRIYENLKHAVSFLVSVHIPIAGLGVLPVMFGWPLMFFPVHVLFLEFIIDPACSFVFEADEASDDLMKKPPRRPDTKLFSAELIWRGVLAGLVGLGFCAILYFAALKSMHENEARALAFFGLVVINVLLIFVSRAATHSLARSLLERNRVLWWIAAVTMLATLLALFVPAAADVFHFEPPPLPAMGATFVAAVVLIFALSFLLRKDSTAPPGSASQA
jgi:Ca2+-transporting ATPase